MNKKREILSDAVYTTEEAAELLGLNTLTIQKYIRDKKIEATLIGGKWYRIVGKELLKFIEDSKVFQIIPCSWRLVKDDNWVARADVIHWMGDKVNVKNWTWENKHFQSKEAADQYARIAARQKLLREHGVEEQE